MQEKRTLRKLMLGKLGARAKNVNIAKNMNMRRENFIRRKQANQEQIQTQEILNKICWRIILKKKLQQWAEENQISVVFK